MRNIILTLMLASLGSPLHAGSLFEENTTLEIDLTGPFWSLVKNKKDRSELPFVLRSGTVEVDLKVRARGNSRLQVCGFPPLRLNFSKADTVDSLFEGQDKLKLVTRCMKGDRYEKDVLEEYAAYRIFSLLSDVGYRVRLVNLTFNDTDNRLNKAFRQSYGFLIEPLDRLGSRVEGSVSELAGVSLRQLDENQAALVYIFQYLIANTDWSFATAVQDEYCCHNIELIDIGSKLFPVPYDFDLSGLVNAAYAKSHPSLKIDNAAKRVYRGYCTDTEILRGALRRIIGKEQEILHVINSLPSSAVHENQKRIDYLKDFFEKARDQDKIISEFEKRCQS